MPDENERYDNFTKTLEDYKKKKLSPQEIKDEQEAIKAQREEMLVQKKIEKDARSTEVKKFLKDNNVKNDVNEMSDSRLLSEYKAGIEYFNGKDADRNLTQRAKQKAVLDIQHKELQSRGITTEIEQKQFTEQDVSTRHKKEMDFREKERQRQEEKIQDTGRFDM